MFIVPPFGSSRADCCFGEVVLNYDNIDVSFVANFSDDGKCSGLAKPNDVDSAFKGSAKKFETRCRHYDIEVDVMEKSPEGFWDVCFISYVTKNVESSEIHIFDDGSEATYTVCDGVLVFFDA